MDFVHQIDEVHCHEIQALDLRARVTVAKPYEGGELASPQADRPPRVVPDQLRVAFIRLVRLEGDGLMMGALHEVHAAGGHHELARRVVVVHGDVHKGGELPHQEVPAVLEVVGVVSERLDLDDLAVQLGDLPGQLVDLRHGAAHVVIQHVADAFSRM